MLRQLRHRCWVVGVPGGTSGSHHPSEVAAADRMVDHLLHASRQVAIGRRPPDAMPVEDLWQLPGPCWTMRCSGCRRLSQARGNDIGPAEMRLAVPPTGRDGRETWNCAPRAWRW